MRRRTIPGAALAVVLLVVVAGSALVWWRLANRGPDQASVGDAIDRFRTSSTVAAASGQVPEAGVYLYEGEGSERLSFLATEQSQGPSLPATLTIPAPGCYEFRIDFNSFHHQSWQRCRVDGTIQERGGTTDQQFDFGLFKQSEHSEMHCDSMTVASEDAAPGTKWTVQCTGHSDTTGTDITQTGTVTFVGIETISVAGTKVRATHVREHLTLSGDQHGTTREELWLRESDALPIKETHDINVVSPAPAPLDSVTYREQGHWQITSLLPRT
jgi:hypothetical protein